ncbi:MAG TPA: glycosyltransferase, partial [Chitinophagaceae bacterium]|nr:glycosyltransferase [Chitinophagaceae bacterium]
MKKDLLAPYNNTLPGNGHQKILNKLTHETEVLKKDNELPEILFITSYPPRECGIATFSQDLVHALNKQFHHSFNISICPLESENEKHTYPEKIKYILNTEQPDAFTRLTKSINENVAIRMVLIQHEFGFFVKKEKEFNLFLAALSKPVILVFHTVLPHPDVTLKTKVQEITAASYSVIVMTHSSAEILIKEYKVPPGKITVIPHGTHLVLHADKEQLKNKYNLSGKKLLSTFGLLSSGKNIETSLKAMPAIVKKYPEVLFIIIGKTHPSVMKQEGEKYRSMLEALVIELQLEQHVQFINQFLPLPVLLEYLQMTDIYLFTSKNPNQAVSGTFSYAISCGCPVVSTPIPHALEVLRNDAGLIFDFENSQQLIDAVISLLNDEQMSRNISSNGLHRMASTAWENAAIAHALLFEKIDADYISLKYNNPSINLEHIKKMTTGFGIIQFSSLNQPDIDSGYTLDDNARAMIVMCQYYQLTGNEAALKYISIYLNFINHCLQPDGYFLNYVNEEKIFTQQNSLTNLADANGRAIWALGYLISLSSLLPPELAATANATMQNALVNVNKIYSTRAMAFVVKGLYYRYTIKKSIRGMSLIKQLANRLVQMYRHEADSEWKWFESYLT